jgi:hypothetical protein
VKPRSEQIRLRSSRTGNTILDAYIEAAEHGDRTVADLLGDLFDPTTGVFRADIFEFREDPLDPGQLQVRVGDFVDPDAGWADMTSTGFQTFIDACEAAQAAAEAAQTASEAAQTASEAAQTAAELAETNASTSESNAATSASTATTQAGLATTAKTAAEAAQTAAETAQGLSETAQTASEAAQTAAEAAQTGAEAAETAALGHASAAEGHKVDAAASEAQADTWATNAGNAKTAAETAQGLAETAQTAAEAAQGLAETAQTASETAQGLAETAQTAAETAQSNTEAVYDAFDDRFLGSKATDPTLDNDGNALLTGALYFNTTDNVSRVYDGADWQNVAGTQKAMFTFEYTATAGQTVFSGADDNGATMSYILNGAVFILNGAVLSPDDYTAADGSTVTLASGATAGDILVVLSFNSFVVSDFGAVTNDIVPTTDGTINIGSETNRFDVLHVDHINGGALSGFRNRLQNPLLQVDIEGNASGVTTNTAHVVEGWRAYFSNDVTTQTYSRVTGDSVPYALRYAVTTGSDASMAAGQYAAIYTAVEGYDVSDALWGTANAKPVWVSGRIKAPTTGTYCVALWNSAANRTYVFEVSCTAATWVDFEKEIPGDTSGTWGKTNDKGLQIVFTVATGSTYHTTADTWGSTAFALGTANQANGLASNGNIFEIENIRVSVGGPIPTEYRPYALDLLHSKRYYEVTYCTARFRAAGAGHDMETPVYFQQKRASPTATLTAGARFNIGAVGVYSVTSYHCRFNISSAAALDTYAINDVLSLNARLI